MDGRREYNALCYLQGLLVVQEAPKAVSRYLVPNWREMNFNKILMMRLQVWPVAFCRMLPLVACHDFGVTAEFLYFDFTDAVDLSAYSQPTFNHLTRHPLTGPTKHPHPLWTGKLTALEMMVLSGSFQYFGAMEETLWTLT